MMMEPLSSRIFVSALACVWLSITSGSADPDSRVLAEAKIEADAESIGAFLGSIGDDKALAKSAEKLFAQLQSDQFRTRQQARLKLSAMPKIPDAALQQALTSGDLESASMAKRLLKKQQTAHLETELIVFACMRTIVKKKLIGLGAEILNAGSSSQYPIIKESASSILASCATPEEDALLRSVATKNEIAKAYVTLRERKNMEKLSPTSWREFFDQIIIRGNGEGDHKTAFLKGVSPKMIACFGKTTKTANTTSSVTERRRVSPWLYPDKQHGEIPKVLEIDNQRLYPLWGTWKQHWSGYVLELNEHGSLIGGGSHSGENSIHLRSTVDFLVIPLSG